MLHLTAIDYHIDLPNVDNVDFDGEETLLDSDVVIFDPSSLNHLLRSDIGKARLYRQEAIYTASILRARQEEFQTLFDRGKIIIAFVSPVVQALLENNDGEYTRITNYAWLPFPYDFMMREGAFRIVSGKGNTIKPLINTHPFIPYYKAFKDKLSYKAYLQVDMKKMEHRSFFLANHNDKPVGCMFSITNGGFLVFLPPPPESVEAKKLIGILVKCAKKVFLNDKETLQPDWGNEFFIPGENRLLEEIGSIENQIKVLMKSKEELEKEWSSLSNFRHLLYENGGQLEEIVIKTLKLLGFTADRMQRDDMEHDVVLESSEGRAIAEIEGKDNEAIHIGKLDQLSRVVDEDFIVNDTNTYAKGILIGNHYRLIPPQKRKEPFTQKVMIAAERKHFGLLTTEELFKAAMHVLEHPSDDGFKRSCRIKILDDKGGIIRLV